MNPIKIAAEAVGSIFGIRTEKQPKYTVIETLGSVEVRAYAPRLAAQTTVTAPDESKARGEAFRRLAGYIFGGNRQRQKIGVTAPVASERGQQIPMTAPVENSHFTGEFTMRFFLPNSITVANAPTPLDETVKIVPIEAETIAVVQYSGSWTDDNREKHEAELIRMLRGSQWQTKGEPFSQLYDPPYAMPFLRKNEAAVRVGKR